MKRDRILKSLNEENDAKKASRKDTRMYNVMLSEERIKTESKYKIVKIPHPFTSREEYERSLQMPIGGNLKEIFI
jgi:U3 small nucleolar RNA-associated protein 14